MTPTSRSCILVLAMAGTAGLSACRSPSRSLRVGNDAATLKVTMSNLDTADHGKAAWLYELSGCLPTMDGTLGDHDVVSFTAAGLKQTLTGCQFRVKLVSPDAGITFLPASEPNVLYWTKNLALGLDPTGQLSATAPLQRLFEPTPPADPSKSFTLQVPVTFPAPEASAPITAVLTCTPDVHNIGTYAATSSTAGTFTFVIGIDHATDFACSWLYVGAGGADQKYKAALIGDAGTVHGVPAATTSLAAVALVATEAAAPSTAAPQPTPSSPQPTPSSQPPPSSPQPAPSTPGDVAVGTTDMGVCKVYDSVNHVCTTP